MPAHVSNVEQLARTSKRRFPGKLLGIESKTAPSLQHAAPIHLTHPSYASASSFVLCRPFSRAASSSSWFARSAFGRRRSRPRRQQPSPRRAESSQSGSAPAARAGQPQNGWPGSATLICGVQASDRDPAAREALWLLDARPAAAQDSEEEVRTTSRTTKAGARTGPGRSAREALRVPPPANGTAARCWEGGPFLRGQRRGAAG